jgi:hypothetical protein
MTIDEDEENAAVGQRVCPQCNRLHYFFAIQVTLLITKFHIIRYICS